MTRPSRKWAAARLGALGACAAVMAIPASACAAGWSDMQLASPTGREATQVQVGVDSAGDITEIWQDDTNLMAGTGTLSIRSAIEPFGSSSFGTPATVSPGTPSSDPVIALAGDGTAVAAWRRSISGVEHVEGATRSAAGAWGSPVDLFASGEVSANPPIAIDMLPNGNGLLGWNEPSAAVPAKARLVNQGAPGTPPVFADPPNDQFAGFYQSLGPPDVAVAPDGTRYLLLYNADSNAIKNLRLYKRDPGAAWDNGRLIANAYAYKGSRVATAQNGDPVMAWIDANDNGVKVQRGVTGTSVPIATSPTAANLDLAVGPPTTEFPNGMVLVTWDQLVDDGSGLCCYQARASVGNGVTMSAPIELSDESENVKGSPVAAVGSDGRAFVVWTRDDGEFDTPEASVRPPGGSFPALASALNGRVGDTLQPSIVTDSHGRALVGFAQFVVDNPDGDYFRAAEVTYDPPPADTKPPKMQASLSRYVFAEGTKLNKTVVPEGERSYVFKRLNRNLKTGTQLQVKLDEPGTVTVRIDQNGCYVGSPPNPQRHVSGRCHRHVLGVQAFSAHAKKGVNKYVYLGNWKPGNVKAGATYEMFVYASDAAGNNTKAKAFEFSLDGKPDAPGY